MNINFDPAVDILYIQFQPSAKKAVETIKLRDGILIDIDKKGHVFGIEILDASHRIPTEELNNVNIHLPVHPATK